MFTKKVSHEKFEKIVLLILQAIKKIEKRITTNEEYLEKYNKVTEIIERGDEIVIKELFRRIDLLADITGLKYDGASGKYVKKTLKKQK